MSIEAARQLAARATRIEAAAHTTMESQLRCQRRAWQLRLQAMRELDAVVGYRRGPDGVYTRRDADPMPPVQMGVAFADEHQDIIQAAGVHDWDREYGR